MMLTQKQIEQADFLVLNTGATMRVLSVVSDDDEVIVRGLFLPEMEVLDFPLEDLNMFVPKMFVLAGGDDVADHTVSIKLRKI